MQTSTGIFTRIEASDYSVVAAAIEYSNVLDESNTPDMYRSRETIPVVMAEMENYVKHGLENSDYIISDNGRTISW